MKFAFEKGITETINYLYEVRDKYSDRADEALDKNEEKSQYYEEIADAIDDFALELVNAHTEFKENIAFIEEAYK